MDGRVTLAYFINNEENTITVYCKHYLPLYMKYLQFKNIYEVIWTISFGHINI